MATLRRRIVTQFCRDLEGELVLERHRHQLEQPQNDILGRRAPDPPRSLSLRPSTQMVPGSRPVGGNNYNGAPLATSAEDDIIPVHGPPLVVPLLMADPLEKQSETIFY